MVFTAHYVGYYNNSPLSLTLSSFRSGIHLSCEIMKYLIQMIFDNI